MPCLGRTSVTYTESYETIYVFCSKSQKYHISLNMKSFTAFDSCYKAFIFPCFVFKGKKIE